MTSEEVVLRATNIIIEYVPQASDGSAGSLISTMLDCAKVK